MDPKKPNKLLLLLSDPHWLVTHVIAFILSALTVIAAFDPAWANFSQVAQHYLLIFGPLSAVAIVLGYQAFNIAGAFYQYFEHKLSRQQLAADIERLWPDILKDIGSYGNQLHGLSTLAGFVNGLESRLASAEAALHELQSTPASAAGPVTVNVSAPVPDVAGKDVVAALAPASPTTSQATGGGATPTA